MLKKMVNECKITLEVQSQSPWLIKDGRYAEKEKKALKQAGGESKDLPDAIFTCTDSKAALLAAVKNKTYQSLNHYIPGTSFRGVLRSHVERIVRSISGGDDYRLCCDPFHETQSCSKRLERIKTPYRDSCMICKLFGSTASGSRIEIEDALINPASKKIVFRDGIGIDRFTGAVKGGANFQFQLLENCNASINVRIRNFEAWHLGLLAYALQDIKDGLISIGFGTSKGFGRLKGKATKIILTYFGAGNHDQRLSDIGDALPEEVVVYGFIPGGLEKKEYLTPASLNEHALSIRDTYEISADKGIGQFMKDASGAWNRAYEAYKDALKTSENLKQEVAP